jgi:hypothetical protein
MQGESAPAAAAQSPATAAAPLGKLFDKNTKPVQEPAGERERKMKASLPYDTLIPPSNLEARPMQLRPSAGYEGPAVAQAPQASYRPIRYPGPVQAAAPEPEVQDNSWDPIRWFYYDSDVPTPGPLEKEKARYDMMYVILLVIAGGAAARMYVKNSARPEIKKLPSLRSKIAKLGS